MKLSISSDDRADLEKLTGLNLVSQQKASYSTEYLFDGSDLTSKQVKILSLKVQKHYGDRCLGAFPSGTHFVVVLRTNLRLASSSSEKKPRNLKISDEDYKDLVVAIAPVLKKHPDAYQQYKQKGLSDMRYNWDVFRASKFPIDRLYKYLNDDHINSALASILKNSGKSSKRK